MTWPSDWDVKTLGKAADWFSGGTPRTSEAAYWGGDIPWIGSGSLTEFRIRKSDRTLTPLGASNGTRLVGPGTVIFVVRGMSLKSEFRMGITQRQVAFGQDCKALVARPGIDPAYLAYAIKAQTQDILDLVDEAGHGTGRLNTDQMQALRIGVPSMPEQEAIAATLGVIDDKLDSNRHLVELIPQLIGVEINAAYDENWSRVPISSLARFVNGGAYTKGATGTGRMVIRIAELNSGPGKSTVYNDLDVPDDKLARPGDLLMSWSGSLGVYRWTLDEAIINQHIFKVIPTKYPAWLVYDCLLQVMPTFQSIARDKATTMGHIQRGHLESTTVEIPPADVIERLDATLTPLWNRLVAAEREVLTLTAFQDALMPELLSGRIRVPAVGEVVEDAV
jgi:type I restriction enzyme S subunit